MTLRKRETSFSVIQERCRRIIVKTEYERGERGNVITKIETIRDELINSSAYNRSLT